MCGSEVVSAEGMAHSLRIPSYIHACAATAQAKIKYYDNAPKSAHGVIQLEVQVCGADPSEQLPSAASRKQQAKNTVVQCTRTPGAARAGQGRREEKAFASGAYEETAVTALIDHLMADSPDDEEATWSPKRRSGGERQGSERKGGKARNEMYF